MADITRERVQVWRRTLYSYELESRITLPILIGRIANDTLEDQWGNIVVEFVSGDSCDSGYLDCTCYRDETDEEMAARAAKLAAQVERKKLADELEKTATEQRERLMLVKLKHKYEGGPAPAESPQRRTPFVVQPRKSSEGLLP